MRPTPALLKFLIALLGLALAASVWDQLALLWHDVKIFTLIQIIKGNISFLIEKCNYLVKI